MSSDPSQHDELHGLLLAMEDGSISAEGIARIDELVRGNVELLRQYLEHVRLVSDLRFGLSGERTKTVLSRVFGLDGEQERATAGDPSWATEAENASRSISDDHHSGHSRSFAELSPFGGFLLSYLIAAIVVGIGMLAGWMCRVSDYQHVAGNGSRSAPAAAPAERKKSSLWAASRDMVDCRWADPKTEAFTGARVPLGRKYALASGLMEITYDTGAKVILARAVHL